MSRKEGISDVVIRTAIGTATAAVVTFVLNFVVARWTPVEGPTGGDEPLAAEEEVAAPEKEELRGFLPFKIATRRAPR